MIKIIICDDHSVIRTAISTILQTDTNYAVIGECADGKQLIETLKKNIVPDIVLMDVSMKEMNGYETTIEMSKSYPHIKVLAFSMFPSPQTIQLMLQYGAVGFLTKNSEFSEIKTAITQIHKNGFYFNQLVTKKLLNDIKKNKGDNALTKKEIELLPYLCSDTTYKKIATDKNLAIKTIDRHKENICKKLKVSSRVGLTALAAKMGLIY